MSGEVVAIAASAWPRRVKDSYMPVFLAGQNQARILSAFAGLPLYLVSHQEGHIMAALLGNEALLQQECFLAVHFSGGTSEIMRVGRHDEDVCKLKPACPAWIYAGQIVDRVGVALGLSFPAGPELEERLKV